MYRINFFLSSKLDQLFESIASFVVPKEVHSKDFIRCFFQIYSSFPEAKYSKHSKTISAHREVLILYEKTFKNIFILWHNLFKYIL